MQQSGESSGSPRRYWGGKSGNRDSYRQKYPCDALCTNATLRPEGLIPAGPPSPRPNAPNLNFVRIRGDDTSTAIVDPVKPNQSPENLGGSDGTAPSLPETGFRKPRRYRNRTRGWQSPAPQRHRRCTTPVPPPHSTVVSMRRRPASETFGAETIIPVASGSTFLSWNSSPTSSKFRETSHILDRGLHKKTALP